MANNILSVLQAVQSGALTPEDALLQLKLAPYEDLGYAKVDYHRAVRQGVPEVIYGQSKTPEQIAGSDLYLYNRMAPSVWGPEKSMTTSAPPS